MIDNFLNFLSLVKRKIKYKKVSYSFNAVDLIVNYIFKNKKAGTYIDVGAQNPISNNNTYLLYKKGWRGINIDLDKKNIDLFNISRPKDINLNFAVSDIDGEQELFFYHDGSPINTLSKKVHLYQKAKIKEIKKIKTFTLNTILNKIKFNGDIDYLNIDVEGYENKVLSGFNLQKYSPKIISIEYLDLKMQKLEFKNNNISNIINSELYKTMLSNNYFL